MGFEGLDLLLAGGLVFQRQSRCRGTARLLDLAVEFLDLTLKSELEIIGPTV